MFFKKKYKTTKEIDRLFIKRYAYENLRESYVTQNKHKRAVECSIQEREVHSKAWGKIYEIYPELKGETLSYNPSKSIVELTKKGE